MTAPARWSLAERSADLARAERDGVELLVIGGGIAGAGVLRDAASRGLRSLLVERDDFASGTSSRSSKMIHGGLRYIGEGQLATTRQACRERDRLVRLDPGLVRPMPFLFPAWEGSRVSHWQVRTALWIYAALSDFRRSSRFTMLRPEEVLERVPGLRGDGLRGAALFTDARVDDARLVLETLHSARALGGAAANHAEVVAFRRQAGGRIAGCRVRDALAGRELEIRADVVVNAAGPSVERVRGLDRPVATSELRPAKGVHLVVARERVGVDLTVTFEAEDRRPIFLSPWHDVAMIGTTDTFSDEIDEPLVTIEEVHYLLRAVNTAFPRLGLTTNDLISVFAGVRPLAADADEDAPPSSVSREQRVYRDPSGLLSVAGGKLTTYRAVGELMVDEVLRQLPARRRRELRPSFTDRLPLRPDDGESAALEADLDREFGVGALRAEYLACSYGERARDLLAAAPPELRQPIGGSRFTLAEIPWSFAHECPASLCDLFERRLRMALFARGQGLPELAATAEVAAAAAGWDADRTRAEIDAYTTRVRARYQISAPSRESSGQRSAA